MVEHLSEKQISELKEAFALFDKVKRSINILISIEWRWKNFQPRIKNDHEFLRS